MITERPLNSYYEGRAEVESETAIITDSTRDRLTQEREGIRSTPYFIANTIEDILASRSGDVISAQEANDLYGVDGVLQFQEPVPRSLAQLKYNRVKKGQIVDGFLAQAQQQDQSFGRGLRDFANAIATQALDPINYIPATKALKLYKLGGITGSTIGRAAIDGAIGNLLQTPFAAAQYKKYGMHYGIEDAFFEVGAGAFIGAGFGAIGGKLKSDSLAAAKIVAKQRRSFKRLYKTISSHVNEEAKAALDDYISIVEAQGKIPNEKEMIAIVKTFDEQVPYKESANSSIYTGETVLRTNTEFLTSREIKLLETEAASKNFFTNKGFTLDELFTTQRKLPEFLDNLKTKLGSLEGTITVKDLIAGTKTKIKDIANELKALGVKATGASQLNAKQAFDLAQVIRKADELEAVTLDEIKALQQRLLQTESISGLSYKDFQTQIKDLVNKFKDSDVNIKNLDKLPIEEQIQALKLMKALQEGNLDDVQLKALLNDLDPEVIRDLYEQANFSREVKDSIPLNEAYDTVKKVASGKFGDSPEPNILGQEFDVDIETGASKAFLDEKNRIFQETIPDNELKAVEAELKKVDAQSDGIVKKAAGVIEYLKCQG